MAFTSTDKLDSKFPMAQSIVGDHENDNASSSSKKQRLITSIETLTPPSLTSFPYYLPFDLILEILYRLPVKTLLQFRSVCKSWKTLISNDPNFAKNHLLISIKRNSLHLIAASRIQYACTATRSKHRFWDSSIFSIRTATSITGFTYTQLRYPRILNKINDFSDMCSCNGLLCFPIDKCYALCWNPTIRKFELSPPLGVPNAYSTMYSLGYNHFDNSYKIIAISCFESQEGCNRKPEVNVHTLGTNYWRRIQEFPYRIMGRVTGKFVGGSVNWLVVSEDEDDGKVSSKYHIVSLDMAKESYREILPPKFGGGVDVVTLTMAVLRDCLCICGNSELFIDVWLMKEYGNHKSWTKLSSVPYMGDPASARFPNVKYIYEDGQVLLVSKVLWDSKLIVYNPRRGVFKYPKIVYSRGPLGSEVYVESLVSPCS